MAKLEGRRSRIARGAAAVPPAVALDARAGTVSSLADRVAAAAAAAAASGMVHACGL